MLFFNLKYVILKKYLQIYYFYIFVIFLLNLECVYDSSSNKSLFVFDDIASGQEFDKTLFFALYDEMNQQVLSISDSEFQIKILDLNLFPKNSNFSLKYNYAVKNQIQLFGTLNSPTVKGSSSVSYLKINTIPSSSLMLTINCPKISQYYADLIENRKIIISENERNILNNYFLLFPVNVRECVVGEIYISYLTM